MKASTSMLVNRTPSPITASLKQPTGQVQMELEGKPLFVTADSIEFLGKEASTTIGGGARWRHPFPQTWAWPPKEPSTVGIANDGPQTRAEVSEQGFLKEYGSKPSVTVDEAQPGAITMTAHLDNLEGEDKQAWIVAPFVMPGEHKPEAPKALAVFPASDAELAAIPDTDFEHPRWAEDGDNHLLFVNPGGPKADDQEDKLLLPDRWSLFAREGDSSVLLMPATGSKHPEAFQVYSGFDNYVELEWAGDSAASGASSEVKTSFQAISLASLEMGEGALAKFGASGRGLQSEMTDVVRALGLDR